jgi:hypothetical protein
MWVRLGLFKSHGRGSVAFGMHDHLGDPLKNTGHSRHPPLGGWRYVVYHFMIILPIEPVIEFSTLVLETNLDGEPYPSEYALSCLLSVPILSGCATHLRIHTPHSSKSESA